jgi:YegS/Rv2252/BmrU family lipid kinase
MIEERNTLLVLNPAAGKGRGKKIVADVLEQLKGSMKHIDLVESANPRHLFEIGKGAVEKGFRRIVSIGGDGTPFELINGLYNSGRPSQHIEWGMIPAGTGNSFLRDFVEVSAPEILRRILAGEKRQVDLVEFSYRYEGKTVKKYFHNILGLGLIADVLKLTNEKLKPFGPLGYSLAVMIRLFKGMANRLTITVDGVTHELENSALVISNSKFTGGAMKIAPMAETADGKVDMVVFDRVNRRDIINIFSNIFKGTHVGHPKVKIFSGSEMVIDTDPDELLMADGELLGVTPLTLKVLPGELTVLV